MSKTGSMAAPSRLEIRRTSKWCVENWTDILDTRSRQQATVFWQSSKVRRTLLVVPLQYVVPQWLTGFLSAQVFTSAKWNEWERTCAGLPFMKHNA